MRREYKALESKIIIKKDSGILKLHLDKMKPRVIGKVSNGIFITERNSKKHFHYFMESYGFNYHLLINSLDWGFDTVVVIEDGKRLDPIKVEDLKQAGIVKYFKNQGFELQLFVKAEKLREKR